MKLTTIPIDVPSELLVALNESELDLKARFQIAVALMFFQEGKLTLGKAIQLSGLSRFDFEKAIAKNRISVSQVDVAQVMDDAKKLRTL